MAHMGFDLLALLGTPLKIIGGGLKQVSAQGQGGKERARATVILGLSGALVLWVEMETGRGAELLALMVSAKAAMSAAVQGKADPGQGDDSGTETGEESADRDGSGSVSAKATEPDGGTEWETEMEPDEVGGSD
jgi:hypothetical protein